MFSCRLGLTGLPSSPGYRSGKKGEASIAAEDADDDEGDFLFVHEASDDDAIDPTVDIEVDPFTRVPILLAAPAVADPAPPAPVAPSDAPITPRVDVGATIMPHSRRVNRWT
ncbi:hypothetical protein U1Q18_049792 [Sarracenia purpurea var. burkii]